MGSADEFAAWSAALDLFEQQVQFHERALANPDDRGEEPPAWTPPQGLGPMPAELKERAQELLERIRVTQQGLRAAADKARDEARGLPQAGTVSGTGPVYVDVTA